MEIPLTYVLVTGTLRKNVKVKSFKNLILPYV